MLKCPVFWVHVGSIAKLFYVHGGFDPVIDAGPETVPVGKHFTGFVSAATAWTVEQFFRASGLGAYVG